MSCRPASVLLERFARYLKSSGSAVLVVSLGFEEVERASDKRCERTEDVSSGIGSSGLEDCLSKGRNGLYGSACSFRAFVNEGIS